ncbi:MAG: hypothetical protein ACP6IY_20975 [Promethearchaeia archaeon]
MEEEIRCSKCNCNLTNKNWKKGVTYKGLDYHHNPPKFMFKNEKEWVGDLIPLCRDCHKQLHLKIKDIMFKHSNLFKSNKSDYWIWINIIGDNKIKCRKEVFKFTKRWLNEN